MNVFRIGDNTYGNLYITPVHSLKFIISLCDWSKEKVQRAAKAVKNEQKTKTKTKQRHKIFKWI